MHFLRPQQGNESELCVCVCVCVCVLVFRRLPHTVRQNRGTRTRQPPATLDPTHETGRQVQKPAGSDRKVANSHQNGSNQHSHSAGQDKIKSHRPATDEVVGPANGWYSCQDGVFSEVCCCRALLWCRFRTRKGLFDQNHDIRYPRGMPTDECGEMPPSFCRSSWCEILCFSTPPPPYSPLSHQPSSSITTPMPH